MADKLPEHLWSIYKTYKGATDYCTSWLVDTAASVGYDINQFLDASVNSRSGAPRPIILQTRHFLDLAKAIAAANEAVEEPSKVLRKLGLALRARRLCAAWFRGCEGATQIQDHNDRHSHFIEVLEQVTEVLRPLLTREAAKVKAIYHPASVSDVYEDPHLSSSFDSLALQIEDTQFDEAGDTTNPPGDSGKDVVGHEIKVEDLGDSKADEAFLSAYCLLLDVHRLRAQLRQTWVEYKTGSCSIAYAALRTNTTIEMVEALETDFYDSTGTDRSYYDTFLNEFMNRGMRLNDSQNSHATNVDDFECFLKDPKQFPFHDSWYLAFGLMYEVTQKLGKEQDAELRRLQHKKDARRAKRAAKKGGLTKMLPGTTTNAAHHTSPTSAADVVDNTVELEGHGSMVSAAEIARHTNKKHLAWLQAAYSTSLDCTSSNPYHWSTIEDQTLLKLREVHASGTIELSTCFAVRAFCDVREILENDTERPLADLDTTAREVQVKAKLFDMKHCRRSNIDPFRLRQAATQIDPARAWQREAGNLATIILDNKSGDCDTESFYARSDVRGMLANSPVSAGLYHFHLTMTLARGACIEVDDTGIITGMLYLYEALGNMEFMERLWPDFEYLTGFHTAEYLFFGGRPKSAAEAYKKLSLAFGYTSSGKRSHVTGTACGNQRPFWIRSFSISKLLMSHVLPCKREALRHLEQLQLLLSELEKRGTKHRIKMTMCGAFEDGAYADLKRWSRDDARLTPTELMDRYGKHLKHELKHHRFDYSALENRLTDILKQARLKCADANIDLGPQMVMSSGLKSIMPNPSEALVRYIEGGMMREEIAMMNGVPGLEGFAASALEAARQKEFMLRALVWAIHDHLESAERHGVKNLRDEVE